MTGLRVGLTAAALLLAAPAMPAPEEEWVAPPAERARPNPLTASAETLARGRSLYHQHCRMCHGSEGRGDGPSARLHARRAKPPKDLTQPDVQKAMSDGEIAWKIKEGFREDGKIIMPAFDEDMSEQDRWRVVLFVRSLAADGAAASQPASTP